MNTKLEDFKEWLDPAVIENDRKEQILKLESKIKEKESIIREKEKIINELIR
jgi:hypothetical protein